MRPRRWVMTMLVLTVLLAPARAVGALATVERFPASSADGLAASPDGALWLTWNGGALHLGLRGEVQETLLPNVYGLDWRVPLTPLADGSMAYVAERFAAPGVFLPVLVRLSPDRSPRVTSLAPIEQEAVYGEAIAPDGSVWIAHACADRLTHVAPDGAVTTVRLRHLGGCDGDRSLTESDSAVAIGGDGTVWLVNRCQGRVAKIPLVGAVREWRLLRACAGVRSDPTTMAIRPSDDGALRIPDAEIDRAGRLRQKAGRPPDAVTRGDVRWWVQRAAIVRRAADGARHIRVGGGRTILSWSVGPDERLWFVAGVVHDDVGSWWTTAAEVGATDRDGHVDRQALTSMVPGSDVVFHSPPLMTAAADGSLWITGYVAAGSPSTSILRLVPSDPAPRGSVRTTPTRVLARRGPFVWLQLVCDARPGAYCTGRAHLAGGRGGAAPFAIPGREARPVRLVLGSAQRRTLRLRGGVRLGVVVRTRNGITTRHVLRLTER